MFFYLTLASFNLDIYKFVQAIKGEEGLKYEVPHHLG